MAAADHCLALARDLFAQGYRLDCQRVVDGKTVYVLADADGKATECVIRVDVGNKVEWKVAFKKGSVYDNFTMVDGEGLVKDTVVRMPKRCVEVSVFMFVKLFEAMSQVQQMSEDTEENCNFLKETANAIPDAVMKLIKKSPALDDDKDDVVRMCKAWPTTPITGGLEACKKAWIERHNALLWCKNVDPKIAKLCVGRALPAKLLGRFFDKDLGLAETAIVWVRTALLMTNKALCAYVLATGATEEISNNDDLYALKIEGMPNDKALLDFMLFGADPAYEEWYSQFKPDDAPRQVDFEEWRSMLVEHMVTKAPERLLGKYNEKTRDAVMGALDFKPVTVTPAMQILINIGWRDWWNDNMGTAWHIKQDVFEPVPMFDNERGYVYAAMRGEIALSEVFGCLETLV